MEELIIQMMAQAGITEGELKREKRSIHPVGKNIVGVPVLCQKESSCLEYSYRSVVWGERPYDVLRNDIRICEVDRRGLTVMKGGEHWFHTKEQMAFLDAWIKRSQ